MDDPIPSKDDLTETWFTEMLRREGALDGSTTVTSVTLTPFGGAESMMSALHRATLRYDGPTDAPASLIVKLASSSERQRFIAAMFKFYEREVRFYADLAATAGVRTPRCYLALMHPTEPDFILVLEELTGLRQVDQVDGVGFEDALTVVRTLADLHAPFWDGDLERLEDPFMPLDAPPMHGVIPMQWDAEWPAARDRVAAQVDPEVLALADRRALLVSRMLHDLTGPNTFAHADCRSDNILFDDEGMILLDFQLAALCHGMADVSYFIAQSVRDDVAATRSEDLIEAYFERLGEHGVEVDRVDAMRPYRASLLFFFSIPVNLLANPDLHERSELLGRTMLRRLSAEILRTNTHLHYV